MTNLKKSNNKIISGVCGGIAESLNMDPTIVRVLYAILTFCSVGFPGIILYIVLMIVMPEK
mgnify:CR=1 FL=1